MTPPDHQHVQRLFMEIAALPEAERWAALDRLSGGGGALRARVERLLGATAATETTMPEEVGSAIGPYRLLHRIGQGGFGEVWLAEQREPIARRVALKLIKPGMDSRAIIARFEQERQALALMDHPNIASVHDAGTTPAGRPYFVMEHVKGTPITEFCDRERLTITQRLRVFVKVCDAVQHAHAKGVIHRDLKPSNVLVSAGEGGEPRPVVIDFGLAKAVAARLTEKTIYTERGQLIGTPEYMSPEQAEMAETDIDTRTDVYALGVILYELLTGTLPFDPKTLRAAGYAEIQRIIREVDPPRPSTRLGSLREDGTKIADARRAALGELASRFRRELEWIPLRALRKDRTERYRTAAELSDDVCNYLALRPLIAGPESAAYRVRKFARRHQVGVLAGAAVLLALVLGLAGTAWQFTEARQQARRADERAAAAQAAQKAEKARLEELKQVLEFQANMLAQVDPAEAGKRLTLDVTRKLANALDHVDLSHSEREQRASVFAAEWNRVNATDAARDLIEATILKPAVAAIEQQFNDQPVVAAHLRDVLADRYRGLGLVDAALPLETLALETRRRLLGEEHPDTITSISHMGSLLWVQGRLAHAEPFLREALEKSRRVLGPENRATIAAIGNLGSLLWAQGRLAEAEPFIREALEMTRRVLGEEHPNTLVAIDNMGVLLQSRQRLAEAEPYCREAVAKCRRVLGEEHPDTITSINNMGSLLRAQGKLAEAEPYCREAMEKRRRVLGQQHPSTLASIASMASLLRAQGKPAEAEPLFREAIAGTERAEGRDHASTASFRLGLGQSLTDLGRFAHAESELLEAQRAQSAQDVTRSAPPQCFQALVTLYEAWDKSDPGRAHDAQAAVWKARLEASHGTCPPNECQER
jgi:serine/threonine protein kinase/tetratricopeptide (TPR) repeat protein